MQKIGKGDLEVGAVKAAEIEWFTGLLSSPHAQSRKNAVNNLF